jgi:hypothetical protein
MTTQKDFKRLVRARMLKTGEAYTAARAQLLKKSSSAMSNGKSVARVVAPKPAGVAPVKVDPKEYAKLAGMADAKLKAATGCAWEKWVKSLDHHKAYDMKHSEIAEIAAKKYKAPPWWSQMIAVGYERIRGLRARGQQRDGSYQAGKSRTFAVPVDTLFDAWADAAMRKRWLNGATVRVRTATKPKSMRLDWDGGILSVGFLPKGKGKSVVAVERLKVNTKEAATQFKETWSGYFDALGAELAERTTDD